MDLLGIGPLELVFVFIIIILVLGPQDMVKVGRTIGRFLNQVVKSDTWRAIQEVSREIRTLPNRLAREANLEEALKEDSDNTIAPPKNKAASQPSKQPSSKDKINEGLKAWTTPQQESSSETDQESISE